MKKRVRLMIKGYYIPDYMTEILTKGLCRPFLNMSILHESTTYVFTYDDNFHDQIRMGELKTKEFLDILIALFAINRECEEHLISAENYLIDADHMRLRKGQPVSRGLKIMYYPDTARRPFSEKIISLMESFPGKVDTQYGEMLERVKNELETGDIVRAEYYLVRIRDRMDKAA